MDKCSSVKYMYLTIRLLYKFSLHENFYSNEY